ncbi:conjugal transfer protein [Kribbella sp. CA-293567]|uniref:conjugal transfer protein n=1 Tax=Kribbella sp. CA-293567 TaxID=3002436 RepID=UPI0022DD82D1|nr:conjugal transfer protein [Kribbella sp. CA-293567]WBQ02911.1 conjugal transfer protein [Kribbella sp. CA-293567]
MSPTPRQAQGVAAQYSQPQPPNTGGVMAPPRRPQQPGAQPPPAQGPPGQMPPGQPPAAGPPGQPPAGMRSPERLRQRSPHGAHAAPGPVREPILQPTQTPWSTEPETSFSIWGKRFLRGLAVAVLLLAAISGVRSWIRPNTSPTTSGGVTQTSFPSDEARAVATRYAVSYLNWDESKPDARPAQIGLDLADGLDARVGWNGRGKQTADKAYPGEVKVDPSGVVAVVDVRVQIRSFTKSGRSFQPGPYTWQRVAVPVARTSSRVVASGPPTFVADERAALPENMPEAGVPDDELTAVTMKDAEAFFSAYAESDAKVEAVAVAGAAIRSLNGVVKLGDLKSWQVYTGNDNERRATAAVTWDGAGDTTLDQTYSLTLRRTVAADGAQRWQVAAVG